MSIEISELRPRDMEVVGTLFATAKAGQISPDFRHYQGLSLVAREQDELVAALLCCRDIAGNYVLRLATDAKHREIEKYLVDRGFAKLRSKKITKCRIAMDEEKKAAAIFWHAAQWTDIPVLGPPLLGLSHAPDPTDPQDAAFELRLANETPQSQTSACGDDAIAPNANDPVATKDC